VLLRRTPSNATAVAKAVARAAATVAVLPALASYWIRARLLGPDRALEGSSQALSLLPGVLGQYLRRAFLQRVLASCHASATIEFGVLFSQIGTRIDENVYIGPRCHIGLAHLEADVLIGAAVHIPSGAQTHGTDDLDTPIREQPGVRKMVRIGAGSWVGSNAVVMADVGGNCVVAASAVVTRNLPDRVVAAGVPARVVRARGPAERTPAAGEPHATDEFPA
jgi:virginiamycin A acetyltransferase